VLKGGGCRSCRCYKTGTIVVVEREALVDAVVVVVEERRATETGGE